MRWLWRRRRVKRHEFIIITLLRHIHKHTQINWFKLYMKKKLNSFLRRPPRGHTTLFFYLKLSIAFAGNISAKEVVWWCNSFLCESTWQKIYVLRHAHTCDDVEKRENAYWQWECLDKTAYESTAAQGLFQAESEWKRENAFYYWVKSTFHVCVCINFIFMKIGFFFEDKFLWKINSYFNIPTLPFYVARLFLEKS